MSNITTLADNDSFHFYQEKIDDKIYVCLQMWGKNTGDIKVVIPLAIWEVIRNIGAYDLNVEEQAKVLSEVAAIKKETMFIT